MRRVCLTICALLAAAGCHRHPTITPMPGVLPTAGMLVRAQRVRLSRHLELRQYELLSSDISNDMYPFNISRATRVGRLLSRLYGWRGLGWKRIDHAELPVVDDARKIYVSPNGRAVLYERPEVSANEGEFPRAYGPDQRVHCVAIYDHSAGETYARDCFSKIVGLGRASHWREDGGAVAFTTVACRDDKPPVTELVMLDSAGQTILSGENTPALVGLEFISFSPNGGRIAALQPIEPGSRGRGGGIIVLVDTQTGAVSQLAGVPATLAAKYVGRMDELVDWDRSGEARIQQ